MSFRNEQRGQTKWGNSRSERTKPSAAHQTPPSHSPEAAEKMLETCTQAIGGMRHHISLCAQRFIHGRNIELKIAELDNQLADINGARLLMRDIFGDMAMHESWPLVVKLKDGCEGVARKIFSDSAKDMLERVHTFHWQKSFDKCRQGAASAGTSQQQSTTNRNTTSQRGTGWPPKGEDGSMKGEAGGSRTPPLNPSKPKTSAQPIPMRHFHQFGPGSPWFLITLAEFHSIEEESTEEKKNSALDIPVPTQNRSPTVEPGHTSAEDRTVLTLNKSNAGGVLPLGKEATAALKTPVITNNVVSPNQTRNDLITAEEFFRRYSANRISNVALSHDVSSEEATLEDQSDAGSEASSMSLDAKGFLEARERSVRAERCMEKVEARIAEWKMEVEKERKRRAAVQAAKREREGLDSANHGGQMQCTDEWW